jgi:hypothetical protein
MPIHLIIIMTAAVAFLLWLAFQDPADAEFLAERAADETTRARLGPVHRDAA